MLVLRPATLADVATLEAWDREPHVISATPDAPAAAQALGNHDWRRELTMPSPLYRYLLAERDDPLASNTRAHRFYPRLGSLGRRRA